MTGSVSQAGPAAAIAAGGVVSDIVLAVTERQIAKGETACFPFATRTAYGIPSAHEFTVISGNPDFSQHWARIRRAAGSSCDPRYTLEITPGGTGRSPYGAYPLRLSWRAAGTCRQAGGQCMLIIRPRVRAVAGPVVTIWPAGQVWLLLENRESTGFDCSVSLRHGGSGWSEEWTFALPAKDGPSGFSRSFDPPPGQNRGDFELAVSTAGVPLIRRTIRVRRSLITRRHLTDIQASA